MKKNSSSRMLKCVIPAAAAAIFAFACGGDSDDDLPAVTFDASVIGESDSGGSISPDASQEISDAASDADAGEEIDGNGCFLFGENAGTCPDTGPVDLSDSGVEITDASDAGPEEVWDTCVTGYNPPRETAKLQETALTGVSGIVASRKNPGILWIHNDYKGTAQISAVDAVTGITVAILKTPAEFYVANIEDVALARCPWADESAANSVEKALVKGKVKRSKNKKKRAASIKPAEAPAEAESGPKSPQPAYTDSPCLWLADSGNNLKNRDDLSILIIPEPDLTNYSVSTENLPVRLTASQVWKIPFSYPEDNCDSEAFVVEPDGSAFILLEKVDEKTARIFSASAPFTNGKAVTLTTEGSLASHPFPLVTPVYGLMMTGADLHPSRQRFLLRTYIGTFEYEFQTKDWVHELLTAEAVYTGWGPLSEGQGEAIAYSADGKAFWTVSEDKDQKPGQGIHFYTCKN